MRVFVFFSFLEWFCRYTKLRERCRLKYGDAVSHTTMKNRVVEATAYSTVASGRGIHGNDSHRRIVENFASLAAQAVDRIALIR